MEINPEGAMSELRAVVSGDRVHRPLMDSRLTAEDLEKARVELNETPEVRERLLRRLKEMLAADEKDLSAQTDDDYLLRFLRCRKFDLERSYKLIRKYYKIRANHPDVYPSSPSEISDFLRKTDIIYYSPYRDHMGRAIYHVKMGNWDSDKFPYMDFVAAVVMAAEFVLDNPVTQINGFVGIFDLKGLTFKKFLAMCSPKALWAVKDIVNEGIPGRYKYGCVMNCDSMTVKAWNLFKPFLKEKFRKRLRFLDPGELKGLHEVFDPCILPPEYEGLMPKWDNQEIVKSMFDKEQYIKYSRSFGYRT